MLKKKSGKLPVLRKKIDILDAGICALLEKRFETVLEILPLKEKIRDISREKIVLAGLRKNIKDPELYPYFRRIYKEILKQSAARQEKYAYKVQKKRQK